MPGRVAYMARVKISREVRRAVSGKLLSAEPLLDEKWALITRDAFSVVNPGGELLLQRPWHEVATGEWDDERHILEITWVDGSRATRLKTQDDSPINFPRIFKERVDASVVYSETIPVRGGVIRGALRRTPAGELISQISSDGELQQSLELDQQIAALEQKLWEFIGI